MPARNQYRNHRAPLSRLAKSVFVVASWLLVTSAWSSEVSGREPRSASRLSGRELAVLQDGTAGEQAIKTSPQQVTPATVLSTPQASTAGVDQASSIPLTSVNFETTPGVRNLLDPEKFGQIWKTYSAESPKQETWELRMNDQEPRLICTGKPYGYLRTREKYSRFHLKFEWKYPEGEHGNSGVMLFSQNEDMIWPQALQVQLQHNKAGDIVPIGGAKIEIEPMVHQSAFLPNQWNECVISSSDGAVTVFVNGIKQRDVRGYTPASGYIGLQSEGSPVLFKKILLIGEPDIVQPATDGVEKVTSPTKADAGS